MVSIHANEDPLEYGKQWGMIQNKNVKVFLPFKHSVQIEYSAKTCTAENRHPAASTGCRPSYCYLEAHYTLQTAK
jgi:hypothetical protein